MFLGYHEEDCSEVIKAYEGEIEFQGLVKWERHIIWSRIELL
jgi:hypothetical protein